VTKLQDKDVGTLSFFRGTRQDHCQREGLGPTEWWSKGWNSEELESRCFSLSNFVFVVGAPFCYCYFSLVGFKECVPTCRFMTLQIPIPDPC